MGNQMTNPHISDERLAALKAGLEGVTRGPWIWDGHDNITVPKKDAAHIANCDPDTIASLIARLEAAEANVDQLRINLEHAVKIIEKHVPIDALGEGGGICPEPGMPDQTRPLLEEYLHYMREALSKTATKTIEGDG